MRAAEEHSRSCDADYPDRPPDHGFYRQLTPELGLTRIAASRDWCDACIDRIRARYQIPEEAAQDA